MKTGCIIYQKDIKCQIISVDDFYIHIFFHDFTWIFFFSISLTTEQIYMTYFKVNKHKVVLSFLNISSSFALTIERKCSRNALIAHLEMQGTIWQIIDFFELLFFSYLKFRSVFSHLLNCIFQPVLYHQNQFNFQTEASLLCFFFAELWEVIKQLIFL